MKYIEEFRNKDIIKEITYKLKQLSTKPVVFMEVCGGHTMAIQKFGIPSLLPKNIRLTSGPGCPVCVTDRKYLDQAIAYSRLKNVIITTYGDLIRIPGTTSTLNKEKANNADVRIVYSSLEALDIAKKNPDKQVIFLGIGFETTTPASVLAIKYANEQNVNNFFLYSSHKIMPPAMKALIDEGVKIDGYIAPGHVSAITGSKIYDSIPEKYKLPVVVSGFEPVDLMQSIYMLVQQVESASPRVDIQYKRVVKPEGNTKAQELMAEFMEPADDWWRGLGVLKDSGLKLKEKYARFDAEKMIAVDVEPSEEPKGCICGEILKGIKSPHDCKLFGKGCTPTYPIGACMVSNEGSCAAFYRYNKQKKS